MTEYQPGTCNINSKESRKRLVTGAAGLLNAFILTALVFFFPALQLLYIPIFLLIFVGFLGYFQHRENFCAALGLRGKLHIGESKEEVSDPEKVSEDRMKALSMIAKSFISASIVTSFIYLLI